MAYRTAEEQREYRKDRDERDRQIKAQARTALADPAQVERMIDVLMRSKLGPNVSRYSLRNLILCLTQAEARGLPLSDVYGRKALRALGRTVRPDQYDHPIRITVPYRRRVNDTAEGEQGTAKKEPGTDAKDKRPTFYMRSVYDLSQTETIDDDGPAAAPDPLENQAAALLDTFTAEVDRHGYRIVTDGPDGPGRPSQIDHDQQEIYLVSGWSVRNRVLTLALGIAQILQLTDQPDEEDGEKADQVAQPVAVGA